MSDQRRRRLQQVIHPLVSIDDFTSDEAKTVCRDASPRYVTVNLQQLVRDGILVAQTEAGGQRFRWVQPKSAFDPDRWIERQIRGNQVNQTPLEQRPRERLLRSGAGALSEADLLAILIRVGVRNESAISGGQKLANHFRDRLPALTGYSPSDLKAISPAITTASYAQVVAGIELGRRIARIEAAGAPRQTKITSTAQALEYCRDEFARLAADGRQEEFHIVTLDTKHKPIHTHLITLGTLDASLVHPREVFRPAIRDAAAAILLVHNHPSGDPTPSREDRAVTDQLSQAGKLLGIRVLDHIIVAEQRCVSIREAEA